MQNRNQKIKNMSITFVIDIYDTYHLINVIIDSCNKSSILIKLSMLRELLEK